MPPGSGWCLPMNMFISRQPQIFLALQVKPVVINHLRDHEVNRVPRAGWWRGSVSGADSKSVYCLLENIKIIKLYNNQSAVNYHDAPAILNVSDKTLLQKYIRSPSFRQLLWLFLNFYNIYLSIKLYLFITHLLANIVFYMEFNSKNSVLQLPLDTSRFSSYPRSFWK